MQDRISRFDIKKVVVILAGPRTGSSFLFEALSRSGSFLTLDGEDTPLFRKQGLGILTNLNYSDHVAQNEYNTSQLDGFFEEAQTQLGVLQTSASKSENYAKNIIWRLKLQWPHLQDLISDKALTEKVTSSLQKNEKNYATFYSELLTDLRQIDGRIDLNFYSAGNPDLTIENAYFEEPPYIVPKPKLPLEKAHLDFPLLLKTSTGTYRTDFLKDLFPKAEFRWICLSRNPAASINGLIEGWLSNSFQSHKTTPHAKLNIKGYSEVKKGGTDLWKFDMPKGWSEYINSPLEEVCGFQWQYAYEQIYNFMRKNEKLCTAVQYEKLDVKTLKNLVQFCQTSDTPTDFQWMNNPVASVSAPQKGKWKKREAQIMNILKPSLISLAGKFNYESDLKSWE
ncbi:MAG: hypothetical protein ACXVAX_04525 [Pseudobdellovibrio sp.]